MTKDAIEKARKKATPLTRQGPSGAPTQLTATAALTNERTTSPADTNYVHPELINTV